MPRISVYRGHYAACDPAVHLACIAMIVLAAAQTVLLINYIYRISTAMMLDQDCTCETVETALTHHIYTISRLFIGCFAHVTEPKAPFTLG